MSEELKPCAQCGGDAQTDFIEGETYIIECYQCGMRTGWEDSPQDAIAAWNRRTPAEPTPASTGRAGIQYRAGADDVWHNAPSSELESLVKDGFQVRVVPVAARELDVDAERRGFQTRMGPQGDDPIPAWWYHLHAAAEALADHGCEANAADVRDIANNLLDQAAPVSTEQAGDAWQPIETAPKTGRTLLLGRFNELGNWRTIRGQWFSQAAIDQEWEEPDEAEEGWYETAVEPDVPNCWLIYPTHWTHLPAAPSPNNSPVGADKEPK